MRSFRCGICGDPWDESPREHEVGGKYANGIITRKYSPGQEVKVTVDLTANHKVGTETGLGRDQTNIFRMKKYRQRVKKKIKMYFS